MANVGKRGRGILPELHEHLAERYYELNGAGCHAIREKIGPVGISCTGTAGKVRIEENGDHCQVVDRDATTIDKRNNRNL